MSEPVLSLIYLFILLIYWVFWKPNFLTICFCFVFVFPSKLLSKRTECTQQWVSQIENIAWCKPWTRRAWEENRHYSVRTVPLLTPSIRPFCCVVLVNTVVWVAKQTEGERDTEGPHTSMLKQVHTWIRREPLANFHLCPTIQCVFLSFSLPGRHRLLSSCPHNVVVCSAMIIRLQRTLGLSSPLATFSISSSSWTK